MKIGLIRCMKTEDKCSGTRDFKVISAKKGAFKGAQGEIEIIGFINCGGCTGDRAAKRAAQMVKKGADTIVLASCITKGNPIGSVCPYAKEMKDSIIKKIGNSITILDYSH